MLELEVVKFIKNNEDNWRDLLSGDPYYINIKEDANYILLKYSQTDSDFNQQICKECRGLILSKKDNYKPVRLAFFKFFNFGEPFADKIHWASCKTRMKIDGSMLSCWYDNDEWHLSTSGAIDAWKTPVNGYNNLTFGDVFEKALANNNLTFEQLTDIMRTNICYTFELVSPETRVVIPYKKADLYLIGCRNMLDLEEWEIEGSNVATALGIKTPQLYPLNNAKACLHAANQLSYNEEGYVVVDKYFNRVKIKSPSYVHAHHVCNNGNVTESRIFDIVEQGEKDEFLTYFPEHKELFEKVEAKKRAFEDQLWYVLDKYYQRECEDYETKGCIDRKQYAKDIFSNQTDKKYSQFIFKLLDSNLINTFIMYEWSKLSKEKKLEYLDVKNEEK